MKKLKLQKALLTICLAFATTLQIRKEINATKQPNQGQNDVPKQQNSKDNVPKEPINFKDTYSYMMGQHLKSLDPQKPFTPQEHIDFLRLHYIQDDLTKYLALMIQANYKQIPIYTNTEGVRLIPPNHPYDLLITNPSSNRDEPHILTNGDKNEQMLMFINYLFEIRNKPKETKSKEDQILNLLFLTVAEQPEPHTTQLKQLQTEYKNGKIKTEKELEQKLLSAADQICSFLLTQDAETKLTKLTQLITDYANDEHTPVDTSYHQLKSGLGQLAPLLNREHLYQKANNIKNYLDTLAKLVSDFSDAYNKKLKQQSQQYQTQPQKQQPTTQSTRNQPQPKQTQQQTGPKQTQQTQLPNQPKKKDIPITPKQALQSYIATNKIHYLSLEKYQKFLKYYIQNNPATYLALLILAKYKLLQFTDIKQFTGLHYIDTEITSNKTYNILYLNQPNRLDSKTLMDIGGKTAEINDILKQIYQTIFDKPEKLKVEAQIIQVLFSKYTPWGNIQTSTNRLKTLIKTYKPPKQTDERSSYNNILSLLFEIATQLQNAVYDLTDPVEKEQLRELSQQVKIFASAYTGKQEQNKEQKKEEAEKAKIEQSMKAFTKIINNLSATNKMLQILKLILY